MPGARWFADLIGRLPGFDSRLTAVEARLRQQDNMVHDGSRNNREYPAAYIGGPAAQVVRVTGYGNSGTAIQILVSTAAAPETYSGLGQKNAGVDTDVNLEAGASIVVLAGSTGGYLKVKFRQIS